MRQLNILYRLHILITFLDLLWADTCNVFIVLSLSPNHLFCKRQKHFIQFNSMFILKLVPRLHIQSKSKNNLFQVQHNFWQFFADFEQVKTCYRRFKQRYVKNVFLSLYLEFNESLKEVKMKYKVISFIAH